MELKIQTFAFQDHKISYLDQGNSTPMIFLHSGGTDHYIWQKQINFFSTNYRVIAIDLLGCGKSDRPNRAYDLSLYMQLLTCLVDNLKLEKFILIGACVGGATALEYAGTYPEKVRALILFNVFGGTATLKSLKLIEWGVIPSHLAAEILSLNIFPQAERLFAKNPPVEDALYDHITNTLNKNPLRIQSRGNYIAGAPSFNKFGKSYQRPLDLPPTFLFWGEENRILHVRNGEEFALRLKPNKFHILKNAGHMAMYEQETATNDLMADFLRLV